MSTCFARRNKLNCSFRKYFGTRKCPTVAKTANFLFAVFYYSADNKYDIQECCLL